MAIWQVRATSRCRCVSGTCPGWRSRWCRNDRQRSGIPTQAEIEEKLRGEDLDVWLELWRAEQGLAKPGALKLIADVIPFPIDEGLRVLDVGCGPGDAGRAIHSRFQHAQVDFVDQNEFFVSLCGAVNRRDGVGGRSLTCDVSKADWKLDLRSDYDVVVAVNAIHWLSLAKAEKLLGDIFRSLRSGGVFLLMEPVGVEPPFAAGFDAWLKGQPSQHKYEDWRRFWSRVKDLVGYDYGFLGEPEEQSRIGNGLSVMRWVGLLAEAGFEAIEVLLRDAEKVVLASVSR